ncbi:MAG TPA: histidine phosphatase family protein [Chloroflexota bacterium]|nr:histidine phosphatase family protein [Chloroflexota bacterium]
MTKVYLVRHGQSVANVERVFSNGKVDLPLTDLGVRQAEQAAAWLLGKGIEHVFSAPLLRARQTAAIVATCLGLDESGVTILQDLDEVRVGDLDGRRDDESWATLDRVLERWREGDLEAAFPGGETLAAAMGRFEGALKEIAQQYPSGTVAAVSHGAIQLTVVPKLCSALGEEMRLGRVEWTLANAAITALEVSEEGWICHIWGSVEHIQAEK